MNVLTSLQKCISFINVSLWNGNLIKCDSASGREVDSTSVRVVPDTFSEVIFSNLPPGNYCVRMKPFHPSCGGTCTVIRSDVLPLRSFPQVVEAGESTSRSSIHDESPLTYILCTCIVIAFVLVSGFIIYRKGMKSDFSVIPSFSDNEPTQDYLMKLAEERAKTLEVVLLSFRDFDKHTEAVDALNRFLSNCFGLKDVYFDQEQEASISINPSGWVENIISRHSNRKIMIVESEGAILQENGRRNTQLVRPQNEDFLDNVFPYATDILKCEYRGLCDYQNVFVVKFSYTPDDLKLKYFVPNRRYKLPNPHLFELFCALLDLPRSSSSVMKQFEDEMMKKWTGTELQDLNQKTRVVSEMLRQNPNLVRESVLVVPAMIDLT